MADELVKVVWTDNAVEQRETSQKCPLYLLMWDAEFGSGVFTVLPHKYLGRPGSHIGDEIYHVVSGTLWVFLPDFNTIKRVETGESLYMPARTTHAPLNDTDDDTVVLTCSAPLNADADIHYTMDLADIARFMGEGKGQRGEEPRVFSVDGVVSSGKSSNSATGEHFVTGKTMAAGAFFIPPGQDFADVVHRDTHSVWYAMRGQLTIEEQGAGEKKVVPQGKAAYLAPGASVKVRNEGSDELLVYYASAVK